MGTRGFTLVELTVVIFIMAMLCGILLPALGLAREETKTVACSARIRDLALGLITYDADNGSFPYGWEPVGCPAEPGPYAGSPLRDLVGYWWFESLGQFDYTREDGTEALTCPSKHQGDRTLQRNPLCGNYGANMAICTPQGYLRPYAQEFGGPPRSTASTDQPVKTLLLVDSGYSLISWWHAVEEAPEPIPAGPWAQYTAYIPGLSINKGKILLPGQTEDAIGGRHPGRTVNVAFVDGHVETTPAENVRVDRTDNGYANCRPLWQAD